jgi:tetratricopeptide (TPR) repeat protein
MSNRICLFVVGLLSVCQAAMAADRWVEVDSPHFSLLTDAGEKDGRKIVDQFERMRWVFQTLFPRANVDPAVPIVVVAAKDEKTFNGMEPPAYLAKGSMKLGGYFMHSSDRNYILVRLDTEGSEQHPFATVYHEYTHLQFTSASAWMPLWMNEGTAEFFQNTQFFGKEVRIGQASAEDIFYLRNHSLIPLTVLLAVDQKSPYYHEEEKGSVFYAESWALMHYLMISDRQKNTHRVEDYERLLINHEDPVTAAEKAFGGLKQLEQNLDGYVRQAMYMEFVLNTAAAPIDESTYKVQPVTQTDADARRADVLASVQRTDEARALAEAVLKTDPSNALANETLGFLAFRSGKLDEARKYYGEAVKLGSTDFLAYFYYAQFSMGQGDNDAVESSLKKAIQLNPRFAPSYDRLAAFYGMNHEHLDEAHRLNVQAIELEPAQLVYRLNAVNILIETKQFDEAQRVLQAATKIAKTPTDAAMVESATERLQQYQERADVVTAEQTAQPAAQTQVTQTVVDLVPKYPTLPTGGPHLSTSGVISKVTCNYPSEIEFRVTAAKGAQVALYANDFRKIDLSAAANVTVPDTVNPCSDFEGKSVRVQYVKSQSAGIDGQVIAVELMK